MNLKFTKDKYKEIGKKYLETQSSEKVAKMYNADGNTIRKIVKSLGITLFNNKGRKYYFKEDFFINGIDSSEKAYIFGLLLADGCNSGESIILSLQEKDKYILDLIKQRLEKEGDLLIQKRKKKHHQNRFRLELNSKKLAENLKNLGMIERKSLTLSFPFGSVGEKYMPDFIRGYFDGDGSVFTGKENKLRVNITSSRLFCSELKQVLKKHGIFTRDRIYKNPLTLSIITKSNADSLRFYNFIYQNTKNPLFLTRKKEKFESFVGKRTDNSSILNLVSEWRNPSRRNKILNTL